MQAIHKTKQTKIKQEKKKQEDHTKTYTWMLTVVFFHNC